MNRIIDHIVYCVPNFEKALQFFREEIGVDPFMGGRHLTKGTKNAILNLGNSAYLEILAIDLDNTKVIENHWMGIDLISTPRITRWSLKSADINKDGQVLSNHQEKMGVIEEGQRMTTKNDLLKWKMTLPMPTPLIEIIPFMTDWSQSNIHPTNNLPHQLELVSIAFEHQAPERLNDTFSRLSISEKVDNGTDAKILLTIKSDKGTFLLT